MDGGIYTRDIIIWVFSGKGGVWKHKRIGCNVITRRDYRMWRKEERGGK